MDKYPKTPIKTTNKNKIAVINTEKQNAPLGVMFK